LNLKDDKLKKMLQEFTDKNLEQSVNTNGVVVVDFWAEWCGPCRMYGPILAEFAEVNEDVVVGKVNVDESSEAAAFYGIRSIPTTIVFKNGEIINRLPGVLTKEKLKEVAGL